LFAAGTANTKKTVYQGDPKEGRLFAEETRRCEIHGMVLKAHYEIVRERKCLHHIRFGLWEKPPGI
jgi:hypothetical protein